MSELSWETKGIDCEYFDKDCVGKDCNSCPYRFEEEPEFDYDSDAPCLGEDS